MGYLLACSVMPHQLPNSSLRRLSPLVLAAALFVLPSAAHAAQSPTVAIGVGENAISVTGADEPGRGAVRLQITADDLGKSRTVAIIERKRLDVGAQAERFGRVAGAVSLGTADPVEVDIQARRSLLPSFYDSLTEILRGLFRVAGIR